MAAVHSQLPRYFQQDFFESVARWLLSHLSRHHNRIESQQISNMVYSFGKLGFKSEQTLLACAQNAMQEPSTSVNPGETW
jgi:hypothetical protein